MQSSYNSSSLQLIFKETVNLFHKIEVELERYISEGSSVVLLDNINELLAQIRGTMVMVDLPATLDVLDEIKELIDILEKNPDGENHKILTSLCHAIAVLPRYLEFVKNKTHGLPFLLLPTINELRHRLGKNKISLSHFFRAASRPKYAIKALTATQANTLKVEAPKLLQRYQQALLAILTFGPEDHILTQMLDAISEIRELTAGLPINELWLLSEKAVEAFIDRSVKFTKPRRKVFAQIDRVFKAMVEDEKNYQVACPDAIIKELLYIIALTEPAQNKYQSIKDQYQLPNLVANERELLQEYYNFKGPSASALAAAFTGLQEDVGKIIDVLNPSTLNNRADTQALDNLATSMARIGKSLIFLNRAEGEILLKQIRLLNSIPQQSDVNNTNKIINAVSLALTQINVSLARAVADPFTNRKSPLDARVQKGIRNINEKNGFEDARKYLKNIRNGLSDFIATREATHIQEVPKKIKMVCEGLTFIKVEKAPDILYHCFDFVENGLMNANNTVTSKQLTILADAITGIDYFLECQLNSQPIPNSLLERLESKVKQISVSEKMRA